jgi:hypothetical protein
MLLLDMFGCEVRTDGRDADRQARSGEKMSNRQPVACSQVDTVSDAYQDRSAVFSVSKPNGRRQQRQQRQQR